MAVIETKEQKEKAMRWKRVFNTPDGRKVFNEIISDMMVFDSIDPADKEHVVLRNYGLTMLYNVGGLHDGTVDSIVNHIVEIPLEIDDDK